MKSKVITMQALGSEPDGCAHCGTPFRRGETMTAIPFSGGAPSGWYCPECTADWRTGAAEWRRPAKGT